MARQTHSPGDTAVWSTGFFDIFAKSRLLARWPGACSAGDMGSTNFTQSLTGGTFSQQSSPWWSRAAICSLVVTAVAPVALLGATHAFPGFGPFAADALRAVVGTDRVAHLEDTVYSVRDSVNQVTRSGEAPRAYWAVPDQVVAKDLSNHGSTTSPRVAPSFSPATATIPFPEVSAPGDGVWIEVSAGETSLRKTLIHPDPTRTWAELFVVAVDLTQLDLTWVPGLTEPENTTPGSDEFSRVGTIPAEARPSLIAAFNGGFKTQHGNFGAQIDAVTLVTPLAHSCTLAQSHDGKLHLGTYATLKLDPEMRWLRQTPGCMIEHGAIHPGLVREDTKNWGATLDGATVIRRSALGLSVDGKTLFVGISNDTTARALAVGMQSAGADTVAQLDVNYAYPKFVLYDHGSEEPLPRSLVDGFSVHDHQYLRGEDRDFFYLTKNH